MQNIVDMQKYPEKLVPSSLMQNANHINDIRNDISYQFIQNIYHQDILQQYIHNDTLVSLGFCRLTISGTSGRIKIFHTANLTGFNYQEKIDNQLFYRKHILQSPIKYLGKDLFDQTLNIFQKAGISSVNIMPFESTDSKSFYCKMVESFQDRIIDVLFCPNKEIVLLLK